MMMKLPYLFGTLDPNRRRGHRHVLLRWSLRNNRYVSETITGERHVQLMFGDVRSDCVYTSEAAVLGNDMLLFRI
jgi:hypothetical protein